MSGKGTSRKDARQAVIAFPALFIDTCLFPDKIYFESHIVFRTFSSNPYRPWDGMSGIIQLKRLDKYLLNSYYMN